MNPWQVALSAFGGTAAALVIAGFLSKAIYEHWLKKDFKRFEQKLDDISQRQKVQFTWLHQERAKVIIDIYAKLSNANSLIGTMQAMHGAFGMPEIGQRGRELAITQMKELAPKMTSAVKDIGDTVSGNRIFFSGEALKQLLLVKSAVEGVATVCEFKTDTLIEAGKTDWLDDSMIKMQGYLKPALAALELEFQDLLAVQNKSGSPD